MAVKPPSKSPYRKGSLLDLNVHGLVASITFFCFEGNLITFGWVQAEL